MAHSSDDSLPLDSDLPTIADLVEERRHTILTQELVFVLPRGFLVAMTVLFTLMTVGGALGNALMILLLFGYRHLRSFHNILIANLAASNLAVACTMIPFIFRPSVEVWWTYGEFLCRFYNSFSGMNVYCGSITVCAIAISSCRQVLSHRPMDANPRGGRIGGGGGGAGGGRPKFSGLGGLGLGGKVVVSPAALARYAKSISVLLLIWCLSILSVMPVIVFQQLQPLTDEMTGPNGENVTFTISHICTNSMFFDGASMLGRTAYNVFHFVLILILPGLVLSTVNVLIRCRLRDTMSSKRHRFHRLILTLALMAVFQIVMSIPTVLVECINEYRPDWLSADTMHLINVAVQASNCAHVVVNPLLYGCPNRNFRDAFCDAITRIRRVHASATRNSSVTASTCLLSRVNDASNVNALTDLSLRSRQRRAGSLGSLSRTHLLWPVSRLWPDKKLSDASSPGTEGKNAGSPMTMITISNENAR